MYPAIEQYLASLPNGASSYPDCTVKASVLRSNVEERPLGPEVDLPREVRAIVDAPPPVSVWVPEVHANIVMLAVRDTHWSAPDYPGYLDWVYDRNRRFLSTPLYRAIFFVLSPERLLAGAQKRWSSFRRGSELVLVRKEAREAEVRLLTPPHLYPFPVVQGMAQALRAAASCAGANNVRAEADQISVTEAAVRLRWT